MAAEEEGRWLGGEREEGGLGMGKGGEGGRREGDSGCRIGVVFGQFIFFPPFIRSLISANFILMKNEILHKQSYLYLSNLK